MYEGFIEQLEKAGIDSQSLDHIVHQMKSGEASEINNKGMERQLDYLLEHLGRKGLVELLEIEVENIDA